MKNPRSGTRAVTLVLGALCAGAWGSGAASEARAQASPQPDPDAILESAAQRYEQIDAFCAEFVQERIVPLLNQTTRSEGTLCQMHPAYFLMDFSMPEGDRVVSDGEYFWLHYPSMNPGQVIRTRLGAPGGTYDFYGEFLEDPANRFDATYEGMEEVTGRSTHVLALRPSGSAGDQAYESATVWVDRERELIRKVEIVEENESVRRVTLSDIELDPPLDPSRFEFTPGPDMHVIDRTLPSPSR